MDSETPNVTVESLEIQDIVRMIPHRYPFLMIDRVEDIVPGVSAVGVKNVSINEPQFQGHFPERAIMPGVLMIESMAQTAAVLVVRTVGDDIAGKLVYFMSIDSARFRKPVVPGDQVHVHVEVVQHRGPVWKFKGEAKVNGTVTSEATYTAMIMDN